jgi:hypothetical protein
MRTFAGTLLLEDIFTYVPTTEQDIFNFATSVFTPNVLVVEDNCHTTLGKFETVNYDAEGLTELATETVISRDRVTALLSAGVYSIATRRTSTCISSGGVCRRCYKATYPNRAVPAISARVNITPKNLVNAEVLNIISTSRTYFLQTDFNTYTSYDVFCNGVFLVKEVDYRILENTLTMITTVADDKNIVVRFMKTDNSVYLGWLASSYSGSLLGMKSIPNKLLPMRPLFLSSLLLENRLQLISERIKSFKQIPTEYTNYIDSIKDPLEKALFMLAIFSIYYNVSS